MNDPRRPTVHFISLGCPKNRVDSEIMLGGAQQEGFDHVPDATEADVIVVNTCGFIQSAKQESIETILEMAELKKNGRCSKLIVAGCLTQRYSGDLEKELPEVDHFLGSSDMPKLQALLAAEMRQEQAPRLLVGSPADWLPSASSPRTLSTRGASAYVKIAEGCNRTCSFCMIPTMRGKQRSRSIEDVVAEVEQLVAAGVLEINLISQDTVSYGRDQNDGSNLAQLVRRVADVPGLKWLRLFYLYPETLGDELIELIAHHPTVLKYVDMPLQHAADGMLRRMRRGHGGQRLYSLVERLRKEVDDLTFRTAFIVGHPGESAEEFEALKQFVTWAEFDRVGVFRYSDEEECHSFTLPDKVSKSDSYQRARTLMGLQRKISRKKNRALVGRELDVLVEGPSEENELVLVGRHRGQAPEIDGSVYLSGAECRPGTIVRVTVSQASDYDVVGEVNEDIAPIVGASRESTVKARPLLVRASDGRSVLRTL